MSEGFTQPPGGTFGSSSGGFSGGQSGFGGGSQSSGFGGSSGGFGGTGGAGGFGGTGGNAGSTSGGFSAGSPGGSFGGSSGGFSQGSAGGGAFGASPAGGSGGSIRGGALQSAPLEWILPGLILGFISIGLNVWLTFGAPVATDNLFAIVAAVAWVLAGVLGVLSVGKYMSTLNERKSTGFYTDVPWKKGLFIFASVLLFIAVVWSAWDFALWAGKQ